MPRRKLTGPVKTAADIRRLMNEYRSPASRRQERLQLFKADLVRLRQEGAPWTELCALVSDPDHPFSIKELKDFLEPLLKEEPAAASSNIAQQTAATPRSAAAKVRPAAAPGA